MFNRLRWIPVWMLFGGGMINYMDRSALAIAAPLIMRDLRLDTVQLGFIFSSFFAGYALFNFWAATPPTYSGRSASSPCR
jgi:MFS transporter, ACS family, hexuronate transporter